MLSLEGPEPHRSSDLKDPPTMVTGSCLVLVGPKDEGGVSHELAGNDVRGHSASQDGG